MTGATGFLGTALQESLRDSFTVIPASLRNTGDVKVAFGKGKVHTVIHLSAVSGFAENEREPLQAFSVNAQGTFELLELARHHGVNRCV